MRKCLKDLSDSRPGIEVVCHIKIVITFTAKSFDEDGHPHVVDIKKADQLLIHVDQVMIVIRFGKAVGLAMGEGVCNDNQPRKFRT